MLKKGFNAQLRHLIGGFLITALLVSLTATTVYARGKRALKGAAIGAGIGAIVNGGKGAKKGAAAGALVGAVTKRKKRK